MKILITGKDGQLGWELQCALAPLGQLYPLGRRELDLASLDAIRKTMRQLRPDLVVNAGAYTDVNKAESEPEAANAVNGEAPAILAEELKRIGGRLLVHYSTDYVFDGASARPYREDDRTGPLNEYGGSKLRGEQALAQIGAPYLIFRTEWVYATRGKNFLLTILRLAREGKPLRVVADQVGSPTWSRMIAEATAAMLAQVLGKNSGLEPAGVAGIYHLTAAGQATWHEFAKAILTEVLVREPSADLAWCRTALERLTPISAAEFPTPARRPSYSLLDNRKLEQTFGLVCPDWRRQLHLALREYRVCG